MREKLQENAAPRQVPGARGPRGVITDADEMRARNSDLNWGPGTRDLKPDVTPLAQPFSFL